MTVAKRGARTVVKVGGALLGGAGAFELVTGALAAFGRGRPILVVPGGGPFAEAVRELFRRIKVGDDAAHWMALLGMDQYAHALAARTAGALLIDEPEDIEPALLAGHVPVLAPYRWLRAVDPLPHSSNVTSDSISAWIAGAVGARRLVLIKPVTQDLPGAADPHFVRALPAGVECVIVSPHELEKLGEALAEHPGGGERRSAGGV